MNRNDKGHLTFKYHQDPYKNDLFIKNEEHLECECCENIEPYIYNLTIYARERLEVVCDKCIANGKACELVDGNTIADADVYLKDESKNFELFKCTPSYVPWQEDIWLTHCNDYALFVDYVGYDELVELSLIEKFEEGFEEKFCVKIDMLHREGNVVGYLFKCNHCGEYLLHVDFS